MTKRERAEHVRREVISDARWCMLQLGERLCDALGATECANNLQQVLWTVVNDRLAARLRAAKDALLEDDWAEVVGIGCWGYDE